MSPLKIGWIRTRKFIQPSILGVNSLLVPGKVNTIKSQRFDRFLSTFFPPTKCNCVDLSLHQNRNKKTSCKAPYDWKPNKHGWFPTLFVGLCVSCNAVWRNGFAMSNVDISLSPQILPPQTQFQQTCGQVTPARAKPSLEYSYWPISCGVNANTPGGHLGVTTFWALENFRQFWMRFKAQCQVGGGI